MKKFAVFSFVLAEVLFGASTELEFVGATKAHEQNITGAGYSIGVVDSPISNRHPNLANKLISQELGTENGRPYTPDYTVDTHGSHVAGIAAGEKINDADPYGIAYDAKIYGAQISGHNVANASDLVPTNIYDAFINKDVIAINNSWNSEVYPLVGMKYSFGEIGFSPQLKAQSAQDVIDTYIGRGVVQGNSLNEVYRLGKARKDILFVFASGNEGISSPGIAAILPSLDESLKNFIVVSSISVDNNQASRDANGNITIGNKRANFISSFANGFVGAGNYALLAPGNNIRNVNPAFNETPPFGSADKNPWRTSSGTSQATPLVTGAAALVKQKFPFLDGTQVADVLLSTANSDFAIPKLIVRESRNSKNTPYYSIFYIDNEVPKNQDGSVNIAQVKQDLSEASIYYSSYYTDELIDKIAGMTDDEYQSIQSVTKADIFGQGVLDAQKAMGGLGKLDANRLSDSDVLSYENEPKTAFYKLDTKGNNAEFSNNISQRKWEAKTHLPTALNLPQNLNDLDVGFIKMGSGILTLSGDNSYLGATIIKEGGIRLLSKNGNGGSLNSNTYVEQNANLSGNGKITGNLKNAGIVRPGNLDLSDLQVTGKYTQTNTAKLQLDFGNTDNSKLIAGSYEILGGGLEYIPLEQFYTLEQEYKIDLGALAAHLNSFGSVSVAQNQAITFKVELDADKQSINKDPNAQGGSTGSGSTQGGGGTQSGGGTGSGTQSGGGTQSGSGSGGTTQGGSQGGTQSGGGTNTGGTGSGGNTGSQGGSNTGTGGTGSGNNGGTTGGNIGTGGDIGTGGSTGSGDEGTIIVTPIIKNDAYETQNSTLGTTMRQIREQSLSVEYQDFFAAVDNVKDSATFNKVLDSIDGKSTQDSTAQSIFNQTKVVQNNILLGINPVALNNVQRNSARYNKSYLAYNGVVASDFVQNYGILEKSGTNTPYLWYIEPNYKWINADSYKGNGYGLSIALGGNISDNAELLLNFNAERTSLDFNDNLGNFDSTYVNLGASYFYDFGALKLIGGVGVGYGKNDMQGVLYGVGVNHDSKYDSYIASAQVGVAKDFQIDNLTITPLAYVSENYFYQESYKENGAVFAKNYDSISHFSTSLAGGFNAAYTMDFNDFVAEFSSFLLYEMRLSGKNLDSNYSFIDFPSLAKVNRKQALNKDLLSAGIAMKMNFANDYFVNFGLLGEKAEDIKSINVLGSFGRRF